MTRSCLFLSFLLAQASRLNDFFSCPLSFVQRGVDISLLFYFHTFSSSTCFFRMSSSIFLGVKSYRNAMKTKLLQAALKYSVALEFPQSCKSSYLHAKMFPQCKHDYAHSTQLQYSNCVVESCFLFSAQSPRNPTKERSTGSLSTVFFLFSTKNQQPKIHLYLNNRKRCKGLVCKNKKQKSTG